MSPLILVPIALLFALALFLGRNELVKRRLICPVSCTLADVGVVQRSGRPDRPVRVKTCSLARDARRITCGQGCLKQCT